MFFKGFSQYLLVAVHINMLCLVWQISKLYVSAVNCPDDIWHSCNAIKVCFGIQKIDWHVYEVIYLQNCELSKHPLSTKPINKLLDYDSPFD